MEQGSSLEKEPLLPPPLPGAAKRHRLYSGRGSGSGSGSGDLEDDGHCCVSAASSPRSGGPGETRDNWECLLGCFSVLGGTGRRRPRKAGDGKLKHRRVSPKPGLDQNEISRPGAFG